MKPSHPQFSLKARTSGRVPAQVSASVPARQVSNRFIRGSAIAAIATLALCVGEVPVLAAGQGNEPAIFVDSTATLLAALVEENAGRRIVLESGLYPVTAPLVVPDGITLEGEGVMLGDALPTGFEPGTETTISAVSPFTGDLMTLGDGAKLKGLIVEQVAGSSGNVIVIGSRSSNDTLSASVFECEVVNPNASGMGPQGPSGRSVLVIANNPNGAAEPPPHAGADVTLQLDRSIIRSLAGSAAVFGISFAPQSMTTVLLNENVLGGGLDVAAGVSRPDEVTGAVMIIRSDRNLYLAEGASATGSGIRVLGGSGSPIPGLVAPGSSSNFAYLSSRDDRIEGFPIGITATAGRRFSTAQGLSSDNTVDLRLRGLSISSGTADFVFHAARWEGAAPAFTPGDNNAVGVLVRHATGSGLRDNSYVDSTSSFGPLPPASAGIGNRVEFIGSRQAFLKTNEDIDPAPPAEFFTGSGIK